MRILQVNDYKHRGGCEVIVAETMHGLRDAGHEVECFTAEDVQGHRRTAMSYVDAHHARRALRKRLDDFCPDVVHLHNFYHELSPGVLATIDAWRRDRDVRVVMTAHDYHLVCPNPGLRWWRRGEPRNADVGRLGSLAYLVGRRWDSQSAVRGALRVVQHVWNYRVCARRRCIDVVICPSRYLAGVLKGAGVVTVVVPNPAPGGALGTGAGAATVTAAEGADAVALVFVGRVDSEKGLAEFLGMLPEGAFSRFEIVGDGDALEECRAAARERGFGERVVFRGRLPREEAMRVTAGADLLVLPSRWDENDPVVLTEALIMGTNILVSDRGAMRDVVEQAGTGYRFDIHDADDLAAVLDRVRSDHVVGRLEPRPSAEFLAERTMEAYLRSVLRVYEGEETAPVTPGPLSAGQPCAS